MTSWFVESSFSNSGHAAKLVEWRVEQHEIEMP